MKGNTEKARLILISKSVQMKQYNKIHVIQNADHDCMAVLWIH